MTMMIDNVDGRRGLLRAVASARLLPEMLRTGDFFYNFLFLYILFCRARWSVHRLSCHRRFCAAGRAKAGAPRETAGEPGGGGDGGVFGRPGTGRGTHIGRRGD